MHIFYGWYVALVGATLFAISGGLFQQGRSVLLDPLIRDFALSTAAVSAALSLQQVQGSLLSPLVGVLVDRYGPRLMVIGGFTVSTLGLLVLASTHSPLVLYLSFGIIAIGVTAQSGVTLTAAVSRWFITKRGRALALLFSGSAASGAMVPLLIWLVSRFGWRTAVVTLGLGVWAISLPLALLLHNSPEERGFLPDGAPSPTGSNGLITAEQKNPKPQKPDVQMTGREVLRTPAFWMITLAYFLTDTAVSSVFLQIIKALESFGISRTTAGYAVTIMTLTSLVGWWGFGLLAERFNVLKLMSMAFLLEALGILVFSGVREVWQMLAFIILFSTGFGGAFVVGATALGDLFGRKAYGTVLGLMLGISGAGRFAGPVIAGLAFDRTGSYRPVLFGLSMITLVAVAVPWILSRYRAAKASG